MKPLKKTQILGYTIGDLGINLNFQLIGFWLTYFYTDVFGISPKHVVGLFLAARIWDAINDPIMGYIADHTNSRMGKFRPYLLFGAIPLSLALVACFFTPGLSETGKVVYAYVTYIFHGMMFTLVGLPFSSISAVITQDQQERAVISSYRMFFAVIVAISIVAIGIKPFVGLFETERQGYLIAACLVAVLTTGFLWISYFKSQERVRVERKKYGLKSILPLLLGNKALLVLSLAMFCNTCVWVVSNAVAQYYFKYVIGDEDLVTWFFFLMVTANIIGVFLAPVLTRRIGKRKTFLLGSAVVALMYLCRHVVPPHMRGMFYALSVIGLAGQMLCSIAQWGMLPDTVEYGHWKSGVRSEGIPFAFFSLTQKMGLAVGGALAAFVLDQSGYVANTELADQTLSAIRWLFNVAPAIFSLLCMAALMFYKLDAKLFKQIILELAQQHQAQEPDRSSK